MLYPRFLQGLAENGYTVIATPFPVTFQHRRLAEELNSRFLNTLTEMQSSSLSEMVPKDVPLHGVGHSFGALAHSLISCFKETERTSNVLVAYNNKTVEDAIPIPGFLNTVRFAFAAYDRSPFMISVPDPFSAAKNAAKTVLEGSSLSAVLSRSVDDGFDQLSSIFSEIRQGIVNFDPLPSVTGRIIAQNYRIENTLLVRFDNDIFDETSKLQNYLQSNPSRKLVLQTIQGSHTTPCVGDVRWVAELAKIQLDPSTVDRVQGGAVKETQNLIKVVVDWLNQYSL